MPGTIDWPPPSRKRRNLLILLAVAGAVLFGAGRLLTYYVDALWFGSLGYGAVFRKTLALRWGLFFAFGLMTFAVLYGAFLLLQRAHAGQAAGRRSIVVNGRPVQFNVEPLLRPVALIGSLVVAFLVASSMLEEWPAFARWFYAGQGTSIPTDPIFGRPVSFYLLTLPAVEITADWLITLALLLLGTAVALFVLMGGTPAPDARRLPADGSALRGVGTALAAFLCLVALRLYLSRFDQLVAEHTIFSGVTYADAHILLPGLLLVCLALLGGAALALIGGWRRPARKRSLVLAVLPAVVCFFGLQLAVWAVTTFVVKPNELVKEQPFIGNNIEFTRRAYGLDAIDLRPFSAQTTVAAADAAGNQPTLENIRLWDWRALQDTLRQIQEIRTYYDFPDIDIDRYVIDGQLREVMLAARELNIDKLPESSQNWINERLIYTHGYGLTMNPVNGFTPEGLPTLILSNMPVQSTVRSLSLNRPEVYFGELTDTDVYVKTRQKEFNYPQGQANSLTSYDGTGGIVLGSWLHRVLIALDRGDIGKLPFSDDITPDSRLLMRRNIRERAEILAPFLTFDSDPYLVLGDNGRLSWVMDAYTTSDVYPEARHYPLGDGEVNYLRNSVKVTIDAYDGSANFYVFDAQDPILAAYRGAFPTLFRDASAMPATLRQHIRYPENLLRLQAEAYGLYHMTNPEMFFNREDLWTPATESGVDQNGERTTQEMEPNFVLMKLPGEVGMEFVDILPFTPANRNNLIGWIAGRSDGAQYGKAVVYNFPKTRLVDGPLQVEARVDQNAELSGQLTLWNQQGSHVRRGNLLVIPTGSALLYAESIYLQADRSPMPELRLVVLALQDRLAYGTTFEAAMTALFGGGLSSTTAVSAAPTAAPDSVAAAGAVQPASTTATDRGALIREAAQDLNDYQRLTAQGKLGEAGTKLERLKSALDQLSAQGR